MSSETSPVKKMAELMKAGAIMLAETCPVEGCRLPLFKLKTGEIVCPVHGRVYVVKSDEEALKIREEITLKTTLDKLEEMVIKHIYSRIESDELETTELINLLEILERIYRIKNQLKSSS
ncbi:MAG: Sjogren's syndrome/scleroderma autoantigen 1 family protein [Desulfurococcaceae archaeon]